MDDTIRRSPEYSEMGERQSVLIEIMIERLSRID